MLVPARQRFDTLFPFHLAVGRDLRIVQAGPALLKLSGGQLLGMPLGEAFEIERPSGFALNAETLRASLDSLFILRGRRWKIGLKGQWLEAESDPDALILAAAPLVADLRELSGFGLSLRDLALHDTAGELMTALRTTSLALRESRRRAERLAEQSRELDAKRAEAEDENRAKSAFIATVSHEIRTPLNGILGLADLLLDAELETQDLGMVKAIRMSGEVLRDLLNDVLDMSRIESGMLAVETRDFSVEQLVCATVLVWETRIHAQGLRFDLDLPEDLPPALAGDPARIRQILVNFLSNAAKFTEQGGIALRVALAPLDTGLIELSFAVEDSGIGIEAEFLGTLFDRYTQADPSITRKYGGSGLGLSICKELAGLMGGRIEVESRPGVGSIFRFVLACRLGDPTAVEPDTWGERVGRRQVAAEGPRLSVLVAEDNVLNQTVIRSMLTRAGHEVDVAANGREAVAALGRRDYDLVLMDIRMPEMDGLEATARIRALEGPGERIPIIAVTANAELEERSVMLARGLDDHVAKPIEPALLFAAIDRQVGDRDAPRARLVAETPLGTRRPDPAGPRPSAEAISEMKTLLGALDAFD